MTSSLKLRSSGLWFSLFLIAGCGNSSPTAPTTDFISLSSIVPPAGTALNAGDRVTFTAVVTCTIVNSNGGFTAMVIQDHRNISLLDPGEIPPEASLTKGTTTVTLSHTITIPESGSSFKVLFPMFVNESSSTRAVVVRDYTVR
jgi:hypothetical protein